jgi:hypothetical protein
MASIVLRVKPIEAELAFRHYGVDVLQTSSVLYTMRGNPVDPLKMASILADTLFEFGFPIHISELRHALEAFSHKFSNHNSIWSPVLARMANHEPSTSARYGRDQHSFVGIPADISESNFITCNDWNTVILDSPSILSKETESKVYKQLQDLQLTDANVMRDIDPSQSAQGMQQLVTNKSLGIKHVRSEMELDEGTSQKQIKATNTSRHLEIQPTHLMQDVSQPAQVTSQLNGNKESVLGKATVQKCSSSKGEWRLKQMQATQLLQLLSPASVLDDCDKLQTVSVCDKEHPVTTVQSRKEDDERLRPMQACALHFLQHSTSSSIIVMPTGSGKTRLIWSYHENEDKCAVIFAPYRVLAKQLQSILQERGLTVVWPLNSFSGSTDALIATVRFAVFPYEAAADVQGFLTALHDIGRLGPIWIDEVGFSNTGNK